MAKNATNYCIFPRIYLPKIFRGKRRKWPPDSPSLERLRYINLPSQVRTPLNLTPFQLPRQLATIPNLHVRSDFFLAFPVPSNYTCDS